MTINARLLATGVGAGLIVLGVGLLQYGLPPAPGLLVLGVLVLASVVLEPRYRRKQESLPPPGWKPTGEVFRDEEADRWLRVWYNPRNGERRYVEAPPPDL